MDRRSFIKNVGAISIALYSSSALSIASGQKSLANQAKDAPLNVTQTQVEKAIKAHFGSGFNLNQYQVVDQVTYADVEHLQNHYKVASNDLTQWRIVSSSID